MAVYVCSVQYSSRLPYTNLYHNLWLGFVGYKHVYTAIVSHEIDKGIQK